MEEKLLKFRQLITQTDIDKLFSIRGELEQLCNSLTENEIDQLLSRNVLFIQNCAPSSRVTLKNLNVNGDITLINIDHSYALKLSNEEVVAILLHEIGHVFNPQLKNMEAEYAADLFAAGKGYAKGIISGLERGMKNKWMGFEEESCQLRINNLREKLISSKNED